MIYLFEANILAERRVRWLIQLIHFQVTYRIHGSRRQRIGNRPELGATSHHCCDMHTGCTALLAQADLNFNLLSHRNWALHQQRSLTVSAASPVLLVERTSEHQLLYVMGDAAPLCQAPQGSDGIVKAMSGDPLVLNFPRRDCHQGVTRLGVDTEKICCLVLNVLAVHSA